MWEEEMHKMNSCLIFFPKAANLYGFWKFLVMEEVCVLFEEQWISGDVVMQ